jgi:hypothetical protein
MVRLIRSLCGGKLYGFLPSSVRVYLKLHPVCFMTTGKKVHLVNMRTVSFIGSTRYIAKYNLEAHETMQSKRCPTLATTSLERRVL